MAIVIIFRISRVKVHLLICYEMFTNGERILIVRRFLVARQVTVNTKPSWQSMITG